MSSCYMATGIDVAASEIEKLHHVATLCNKRTKLAAWNDSVTSTSVLRNLLHCFCTINAISNQD